ncbi:LysR substrate-binding domain-containing protein [Burkholderia pseudomultivorans]|uniref:LysR substrate-binding domain-containing protein n=1 Tax=Burkholderia pseudomultivorans TaxID=1207504 RepID=UPI003857F037
MRTGEIDRALGYAPGLDAGSVSETLFADEDVCVVHANHPLRKSPPARGDLNALRYVYLSTNATGHHMVQQWLDELTFKREVVVRLPHFVVASEIVTISDLVVIFPQQPCASLQSGESFSHPAIAIRPAAHRDPGALAHPIHERPGIVRCTIRSFDVSSTRRAHRGSRKRRAATSRLLVESSGTLEQQCDFLLRAAFSLARAGAQTLTGITSF